MAEPESWWSSPGKRRAATLAGLWLAVLVAAVLFRHALVLFIGAGLLAFLIEPAVARLARLRLGKVGMPRWVAVLAIYAVFFLGVWLFGRVAVPKLSGELVRLAREGRDFFNALTPERIDAYADRVDAWLARMGFGAAGGPMAIDARAELAAGLAQVSETLRTHFFDLISAGRAVLGAVVSAVFSFFVLLMVTAFISIDVERIKAFMFTMVPVEDRGDFDALVKRIDDGLAGVVRGQLVICLINGVLTYVGLAMIGVPFAGLLSIMASVLYLVPIFGTIISSVPIVLLALADGLGTAAAALGWIVGIHALEAYFLNPKILGAAARIHPVLVVFALIAGERTAGFAGAIFAVPLMSIAAVVFRFFHRRALEMAPEPKALPPPPAGPAQAA